MPMTDQNKPGRPTSADLAGARVAQDEGLAAMVSAYLDGELSGEDLAEFEALLQTDEALSREIVEMRRINRQLSGLGADILAEPIPDILLEPLARLETRAIPKQGG
jgi:anti-sigma factor RsiW